MTVTHKGAWTPGDRVEQFYRYLPVEVPEGATGLRVSLEYDRRAGVLDLGCMGAAGFRGWSGGARGEYVIGAEQATPGYQAGELEPGEWQVMLGLHRVPDSLPYVVRAEVLRRKPARLPEPDPGRPGPKRPPRRRLPAEPGHTWLAGDLHCHSEHSDGDWSIGQLASAAAEAGLDFLAVTDHNTVSHHGFLAAAGEDRGVLLVPGQEITTDRGHANAFGGIGWIDFRRPASQWLSEVESRGGLLSINHPIATDCAWQQQLKGRPHLAEIWHCTWRDRTWRGPLAWWLASGLNAVPVGGSDFHSPGRDNPIGTPATWVGVRSDSEPGTARVLEGLRSARVAVSRSVTGPVLLPVGDELVAVDADGTVLADFTGRRRLVRGELARFKAEDGPYWLESAATEVLAISP